jgi:hypothetical protein
MSHWHWAYKLKILITLYYWYGESHNTKWKKICYKMACIIPLQLRNIQLYMHMHVGLHIHAYIHTYILLWFEYKMSSTSSCVEGSMPALFWEVVEPLVGLPGGKRLLGACLWRAYLVRSPFFCLLATIKWGILFCFTLSLWYMSHHRPRNTETADLGLKLLKLWAKVNSSFF